MNSNTNTNYICRICLQEDHPNNMIYPCKCNGTSKYVHKDCLNQWRMMSDNTDAKYKCFECNYEYQIINYPDSPSLLSTFCKFLSNSLIIFLFFNFCIILLISQLLSLDKEYTLIKIFTKNINQNTILYYNFIWADIFYAILLFFVGLINFIFSIKNKKLYIKYCFYNKIHKILFFIILLSIIFALDSIIGFMAFTLFLQIIIKYHFMFSENITEANLLEISNYNADENQNELP